MFKKIFIANRGEIALRVINTCKEMGIKTVTGYSDADKKAVHVLEADEAVYLGSSAPSLSYLDIDKIIDAAKQSSAEAIHPGYGFLAENSGFAEKCEKNEIVFIGPPSHVIKEMGDKIISRQIMEKSGVPVTPGLAEVETDPELLLKQAERIGYPILVKATAGGGGKGIRIVNSGDKLMEACKAASSEALNAFGNGEIFIEKFFTKARHVEFQILSDMHNKTVHLLERECSVQRRHQKIIEESPCSVMTPELREKMGKAAIAAAEAAGYVNAGTVEFLVDENYDFYFLEMNTRLQVEHPVTEMVTGIDIVRQQLEIAAGNPMLLNQEDIQPRGHAIECRIYAEDPAKDFFPCPGKIEYLKEPAGPGIRNDSGIYSGFEVPNDYDPILSKLVVHTASREHAIEKMVKALKEYIILGVTTPIDFLIDVLNSFPFVKADVFTTFIQEHFAQWKPGTKGNDLAMLAFIADELCKNRKINSSYTGKNKFVTPFETLGNWAL